MKCANCDAEIKDGSIYCPVCGKEAQMVNGYVSLEDDFLHSLLREDTRTTSSISAKKGKADVAEQKRTKRYKQMMPIFVTCFLLLTFITIGAGVKFYIDYKNDNSYDYQIEMAHKEAYDRNYENALMYYKRALALVPNDIDVRVEMAEIYLLQDEYDAALVLLTEVIQLDKNEKKAYQYLLEIYEEKGQYGKIKDLIAYAEETEIKELFIDYIVDKPTIFPAGDTFYTNLTISLVCTEGHNIYYTIDGTDPVVNGKRYEKDFGIHLEKSGLYQVRAVCKNENGIYGDVAGDSYQIILIPKQENFYGTGEREKFEE